MRIRGPVSTTEIHCPLLTIRSVRYYRTQCRRVIQDSRHQRPDRAVEFSLPSFKSCLCTSIAIRIIRPESGLKFRGFRIVTRSLSYTHITFFCKTPTNKSCYQQARFLPTRSRHFSVCNVLSISSTDVDYKNLFQHFRPPPIGG